MVTLYNKQTQEVMCCKDSFEETNEIGVTSMICTESFIKAMFDGNVFYEGADANEILSIRLEEETNKYLKRTQDGIEAYAKISAEFRLAKLSGQISEEAHHYIEEILIPVRNEVLAGQWISGLQKLEALGSAEIGQQLYDRLHLQISNYIDTNY